MPKRKKTKWPLFARLTKRPLLTLGVVLALLIGGGLAYAQLKDNQPANQPAGASDNQSDGYINLNPPTEQDKQDAEANKKSLAEDRPSPAPSSNGKKEVTPIITSVSSSEVKAYVPGIFEDGGKCTATATRGSQTETASSNGFADVSKTSCAPLKNLSIPGAGWSVVVSYSSSTSQGKSEPWPK
ncbi:MAG TPA: hypothetical protein VI336_03305 [Candidatus Saccharimonadales bacterium]|nr:hypothetical protein [Candidatus Saccharimonadales bacterium]